ncbi:CHAT domain-containing protein [Nocardia amikacinitolerans]|uniref:CHAT domain-containing protein n=1 Tax=Nocardia amikacinitolerans TaxID=756689 RepID=A0A285LQB8_9NOCA|nr:CHAT domain-containing protein [Nocardia amikacinitolerans]SNY87109.1 CHAT domain-containing protein [Nocardia amikacinitolerans]
MPPDPAQAFHRFDISVLDAGGRVWVSASSPQGAVYAVPRPPPTWTLPDGFETPSEWLNAVVRNACSGVEPAAIDIGRVLTRLVFEVPEIDNLFARTRGAARHAGAQVLVRIQSAPQHVNAWPWELLLDPENGIADGVDFLGCARDTHILRLGRFRTYPVQQAPEPIEAPLNVLIVMSSPMPKVGEQNQEALFDLYAAKRALLDGLKPLVRQGRLNIVVEDRPSTERIRQTIRRQADGFQIFHYLGHAAPNGFKLEDASGRGRFVHNAELCKILSELPDLRLAVFAGCETARAPAAAAGDDWRGQMSTADHFVRDVCPMVIGMQTVLPFGTEKIFTSSFYESLAAGHTVATALRLARQAIATDEFSGGALLNWVVPTLHVGANEPGALIDKRTRGRPIVLRPRVYRPFGIAQGDPRFISRLTELRQAIDVLGGKTQARLLHVKGVAGSGKSAFVDRVLDDLDDDVVRVFVAARWLLDESKVRRRDHNPVGILHDAVAAVMTDSGMRLPRGSLAKDPIDLWGNLLGKLEHTRFVLAVDEAELLAGDERGAAALRALGELLDRRLPARVAITSTNGVAGLTDRADMPSRTREIRLDLLAWPEVWQWIRSNQPVLVRFGPAVLSRLYADLPRLEQWDQLADRVRSLATPPSAESLAALARENVEEVATPVDTQDLFTAAPDPNRTKRPLRLALAGATSDTAGELARTITQFAGERGVAGRAVLFGTADSAAAFAEVVPLDSVTDQERFAQRACADIVVVDDVSDAALLHGRDHLVVGGAASGVEHASGTARRRLLIAGTVDHAGPVDVVVDPTQPSTSAETEAAIAALIVWATNRSQDAEHVRTLLLETAEKKRLSDGRTVRRLNVTTALDTLRKRDIVETIGSDKLDLPQVLARTGARSDQAISLVDKLVENGALVKTVNDGVEWFTRPDR